MEIDQLELKATMLSGFSNKVRLQILESIKDQEKTVSQIVEEIDGSQSNISQHLSCLKGCGLITKRTEGKYGFYRLRNENIKTFIDMIDVVLNDVAEDMSSCKNNIL